MYSELQLLQLVAGSKDNSVDFMILEPGCWLMEQQRALRRNIIASNINRYQACLDLIVITSYLSQEGVLDNATTRAANDTDQRGKMAQTQPAVNQPAKDGAEGYIQTLVEETFDEAKRSHYLLLLCCKVV